MTQKIQYDYREAYDNWGDHYEIKTNYEKAWDAVVRYGDPIETVRNGNWSHETLKELVEIAIRAREFYQISYAIKQCDKYHGDSWAIDENTAVGTHYHCRACGLEHWENQRGGRYGAMVAYNLVHGAVR